MASLVSSTDATFTNVHCVSSCFYCFASEKQIRPETIVALQYTVVYS